ncbi:MAG: replication-relaxation family protein, partial [Chloroflexales bacterium]
MYRETDIHNLLISLAWLGELRTDHMHRLWLMGQSVRATQQLLRELHREGYVERRMWSRWVPGRSTPQRQGALWSITRKGRDSIRESDQYPPEYKEPRSRRMVPHDSTTSEAIVRIIELGRAVDYAGQRGISGLYVEREVRLDPARPRPVMDALIIVTVGGDFDRPDLVPWSRDPTLEGERRVRYALENDRDTEPPTVIAAKASHYQRA